VSGRVNESLLPDRDDDASQTAHRRFDDRLDGDSMLRSRSRSGIHGMWERLDEKYLKPLFGGQPRDAASPPTSASGNRRDSHGNANGKISPRGRNRAGSNSTSGSSGGGSATAPPHMSKADIAHEFS
jgi:hypothetical protein